MRLLLSVRTLLASAVVVAAVLSLTSASRAITITVNSLADTGTASICALRDAITAANTMTVTNGCAAGTGNDTIHFSVTGTIHLSCTLPEITDRSLTVSGPASRGIVLSGGGTVPLIVVASGARANFRNLAMFDGSTEGAGGGIFNSGTLGITRCTFSGNTALVGGAIFNDGTLSIGNSTFSSDDSAEGGGIFNAGTLRVTNSTFSDNDSAKGGGIFNDGTLRVTNSTFSENDAGDGGGILNAGTLTVTNSTFAGSNAARGAAVFNSGTANITNCTFAMNGAATGGGVFNSDSLTISFSTFSGNDAASGGGMQNNGRASVKSTILAASTFGGNCSGTIVDAGYNLSDDNTCRLGAAGSQKSIDPGLDRAGLHNNGGPTQTISLLPGSPAIDAIPLDSCTDQATPPDRLKTDQRGFPRPDAGEAFCDIGAYESGSFAGQPGKASCYGRSVFALVHEFGGIDAAASAFGYPSRKALHDDLRAFCG